MNEKQQIQNELEMARNAVKNAGLYLVSKNEIKKEEYNDFYKSKFMDFEDPAEVIHYSLEGMPYRASGSLESRQGEFEVPHHAPKRR